MQQRRPEWRAMLGNGLHVQRGYDLQHQLERVRHRAKLLFRVLDGEHVLGYLQPRVQHHLRSRVDLRRDRRGRRECLLHLGVDLQRHVYGVVLADLSDRIDMLAPMSRADE